MKKKNISLFGIVLLVIAMVTNSFAATIVSPGTNINKKEETKKETSTVIAPAENVKNVQMAADENAAQNKSDANYTGFAQDVQGKWMIRVGGEPLKKDWYYDADGRRYHTDGKGYMQYGLIKLKEDGSKGKWYLFDNRHNGHFGALITSPKVTVEYDGRRADLQIIGDGSIENSREAAKTLIKANNLESFDYLDPAKTLTIVDDGTNGNQANASQAAVAQTTQSAVVNSMNAAANNQVAQAQAAQQAQAQTNQQAAQNQAEQAMIQMQIAALQAQLQALQK